MVLRRGNGPKESVDCDAVFTHTYGRRKSHTPQTHQHKHKRVRCRRRLTYNVRRVTYTRQTLYQGDTGVLQSAPKSGKRDWTPSGSLLVVLRNTPRNRETHMHIGHAIGGLSSLYFLCRARSHRVILLGPSKNLGRVII